MHLELESMVPVVREFLELQEALLKQLFSEYPAAADPDKLISKAIPPQGCIRLRGGDWLFNRHGTGVRFVSKNDGTEVDVEEFITGVKVLTPWRLKWFMESRSMGSHTERSVKTVLDDLVVKGYLKLRKSKYSSSDRQYELLGE